VDDNNLIINLLDLTFGYPNRPKVLNKLSLQFYRGNRIGLIGPNGCGKTTLFHIIMGLLKPSTGSIEIFGKPVKKEKDFYQARKKIGLLFQDSDDQLFCPTVIEDVAFGPLNLGKSTDEATKIAKSTLNFLGLTGFENRITYKLSGGEKRMVSLATILAMEPEILLLDEPITGLDDKTKAKITTILNDLSISCIIISHEIDFLAKTTDFIYTILNGKIVIDDKMYIHQHVHAHPHGVNPHKHQS